MNEIELLVPEAPAPEAKAAEIADRGVKGTRLRLGLLDNSKANADHLLRMIGGHVRTACAVESVLTLGKTSVAIPATREVLDRLAAECDLVLSAMAD